MSADNQLYKEVMEEILREHLPKHVGGQLETLVKGVSNEILEIRDNAVVTLSARSRSGDPRVVRFEDFKKIWLKEIVGVPHEQLGRINHGRIIQRIFYLHPRIGYSYTTQTIYLKK